MTWSSTATRGVTGPRRPLGGLGGFGSLAFSIPLGFRTGRPFSPLSRVISARWAPPSAPAPPPCPAARGQAPSVPLGRVRRGHRAEPSCQGIRGRRVRKAKTALPPPVLPLVHDRDLRG